MKKAPYLICLAALGSAYAAKTNLFKKKPIGTYFVYNTTGKPATLNIYRVVRPAPNRIQYQPLQMNKDINHQGETQGIHNQEIRLELIVNGGYYRLGNLKAEDKGYYIITSRGGGALARNLIEVRRVQNVADYRGCRNGGNCKVGTKIPMEIPERGTTNPKARPRLHR